jgi:hypothetical protein
MGCCRALMIESYRIFSTQRELLSKKRVLRLLTELCKAL